MSLTKWMYTRVISSFYENIEDILDSRISPIKLNFLFSLLAIKHYCLIFLFLNGYVLFLNFLTIVRWNCDVLRFFGIFISMSRKRCIYLAQTSNSKRVLCWPNLTSRSMLHGDNTTGCRMLEMTEVKHRRCSNYSTSFVSEQKVRLIKCHWLEIHCREKRISLISDAEIDCTFQ